MEAGAEGGVCEICYSERSALTECACGHSFCLTCTLYWKICHDSCPFRCSQPWNITLPDLPDLSISSPNGDLKDWNGFIRCENCLRIGCLLCFSISCRQAIEFRSIQETRAQCSREECQGARLTLYFGQCTTCTNRSELYYLFCARCKRKYCCEHPNTTP